MTTTITRDTLESYLTCRYKGHLKLAGERGDKSDYELLMAESREQVRLVATEKLLARHGEGEVVRGVTLTPELLKRGVPLLLDAAVEGEGLSVRFDGLQRRAGPSRLGDFHYLPVLFHEGERPGRGQKALLELLGLVLADLQGKEPDWGVLIHGRGCQVRRLRLGAGGPQARRTLQEVREMQRTGTPPRLTLNPHCQVCEFRQRCHAEATAKDDLSLLRGLGEKEINKYGRRGIFTVTQLSCTFRPRKRGRRQNQPGQPHQHALQALAVRDKRVYVLGTPDLPACSARVYLDLEGDPDRGFVYLLGLVVEAGGGEERFSFWADTPADEPRLFRQLLDVVGRHEDFRLYAYGGYEAAFLRRMLKGVPQTEQELGARLLARLLNVLAVVHSHVYFPTYSNGLKDVAGFLGCRWTEANASGVQSIVWRRRWEETGSAALKDRLTTYNLEDCAALRKVTQCLYALCPGQPGPRGAGGGQEPEVARVEEMAPRFHKREWCKADFVVPDFEFVNGRAYFDYQRQKVFIRTSPVIRRSQARERRRRGRKTSRVNRSVEIRSRECPSCGGTDLTLRPDGRLSRLAFDLRVGRGGARRWVTRCTTAWHHCARCGQRFLPRDYLRLEEFCHALKSWAMYKHVVHRMSFAGIAEEIRDCFGLPVTTPNAYSFKVLMARRYEATCRRLLEKLVGGAVLHGDETEVHLKRVGKGYVWVFTNLEEVVFLYRKSREGAFLLDLLKGFRGVLVSDFYAPYDSLACEQQKCLVHLIRDFNHDLQGNPWDEELKGLASDFGRLLRQIVVTIDRHGLKAWYLRKHRRDIDEFFRKVAGQTLRSEVAGGYQRRLLKYQDKLFTFIRHDGVPWNNNAAEHAVKQFARYRELTDGILTEAGLEDYLVLLSIQQTCKNKGVSFLRFLLSRETDIDVFREGRTKTTVPAIEVYPEGGESSRTSRKRLFPTGSGASVAPARGSTDPGEAMPEALRAD